ncbi:hypothetical protein LCGC14_0597070 [marine sediment metagenome]|uniref:Uncharacterized protein n=1 Tax=marine sediment metagenome TaxID=412755 RepID=A0A0F9RGP6_9ZZZZ
MFKSNVSRRYKSRPYRIVHYCEKYKLEDNLEIIAFDKRFSGVKLRWVLRKRYNYTKRLLYAIIERIIDNSNVIIVIYGTPNSGKSEGAQIIAFFIRYVLWKYVKIKIEIHYAFSTADFQDILPDMEVGDVGIRDESSGLSGAGSKNVQKYLDNITKAVRMDQNSFVFVDPLLMEPDVVSYYLETAGKNKKTRKVRFILYDKNKDELGHIYLPLHWCKRFRKLYKIKKKANLEAMKALAGMVTPELSNRLERDEMNLLQYCSEYFVTKKGDIEPLIYRYNRRFIKKEDMIKGDTHYIKILTSLVWLDIKEGRNIKIKKKKEIKLKIHYKNGQTFSKFVRANIPENTGERPNYIVARIAEGLAKGLSHDAIGANHKDIGAGIINTYSKWIRREAPIEIRLGFLFEKWFALSVGVPLEQLEELLGSNEPDKPDLIWKDKIYSIKLRIEQRSKTMRFNQPIDFSPEYKDAIRKGCKYTLVFMNPAWELKIQLIELDPVNDPDDVIVRSPSFKKPSKMLAMD